MPMSLNTLSCTLRRPGKQHGFSLIELMIVVIVLGILAAIVVPSYQQYIRQSHRGVAKADLVEYAQRAERYYSVNNNYSGFALPSKVSPREGGTTRYAITFDGKASSFTLTATPQGNQTKDSCGTLSVDQANRKTASGTVSDCW